MSSTSRAFLCFAALFLTSLAATAQNTQQQSFVSGGHVKIRLEAGDYKIQPSADNQLRVTWSGDSVEHPRVKVTINATGSSAEIRVANTPSNNSHFHATIEVPAKTDLYVRLSAGDLTLSGITGSKDIESRAGDMIVDVGKSTDYSHVDASVTAGDLNADAFKVAKGGLFRSFKWNGPGTYSLHAHLMAGDLTLSAHAAGTNN
jgi:hypothetical protein